MSIFENHFFKISVPDDPVMYLSFDSNTRNAEVKDESGNNNNAKLSKSATISERVLGKFSLLLFHFM